MKNLNGFSFRTIIQKDIPRTFPYTDKQGQQQVGGSFGQLFAAFLRNHNATYRQVFVYNINSSQFNVPLLFNATLENLIDISFNAHPQNVLDWSYPAKIIYTVMMVPINGYVNPHEYFKRPFTLSAWICIGLALVCITLMKVLLNKCLEKPLEFWHSFSDTFRAFLMLSSEKSITFAYRLYLLIFIFSFIIGNIYVIFFTSFLTAFIKVKQFNTMQDLIDNNFPILVSNIDYKYLARPDGYSRDFTNLFVQVEHKILFQELYSMKNTSYAFILGKDRSDFLINMQASLTKPLFRRAQEGILNDFVMRVKETGLMFKWDADVIYQAPMAGFEIDIDRSVGEKPLHVALNLRHFEFAWNCLAIGWSVAMLVFVGERFGRSLAFWK
ncbi:uncharacterized protein LOC129910826 [Episyrphus balteatus]|uniref:uncharacterized protein LOC129910826 n=1 Tax=Episyrphus balteatus TaxID=286459 RepID=UPI002484EF14|nr:uncharacterized protein LOC129910826 [Episyrphus balteatus]